MQADWHPVWQVFTAALARETVGVQLAVWVGAAFILVMAIEGLRVSLMPGRFVRRYLAFQQAPAPPSGQIVEPEAAAATAPVQPWRPMKKSLQTQRKF